MNRSGFASNLTTIMLVLGTILVIAIILITASPTARNFVKSLSDMLFGEDIPTKSQYFAVHEIGYVADSPCAVNGNTITCARDTKITFQVRIENLAKTGEKDFYPVPQLGTECKTKADCKTLTPIESFAPCSIKGGSIKDCKADTAYTFDDPGTFRVFSGARCSYDECPEGNMQRGNNVYVYNDTQYYNIQIGSSP